MFKCLKSTDRMVVMATMQEIRNRLVSFMQNEELPFPVASLEATIKEGVNDPLDYQDVDMAQALVDLKADDQLFGDACVFFDTHLGIDLKQVVEEQENC